MYQHDSNYSSAHIIPMVSKLFLSVNYTFQYIQIPIHPLNTIYQIIYLNIQPTHLYCFGHFYTCKAMVYTYKPPIYTRKKKLGRKDVTTTVSSKVMRITVVNLKLSTLQV